MPIEQGRDTTGLRDIRPGLMQAAGRVWRDGQKKRVFVYRLLSTGTIEEKMYKRQLSKEGLKTVVNNESKGGSSLWSSEDLRDIFTLRTATVSDTYDTLCCNSDDESEKENDSPQEKSGKIRD